MIKIKQDWQMMFGAKNFKTNFEKLFEKYRFTYIEKKQSKNPLTLIDENQLSLLFTTNNLYLLMRKNQKILCKSIKEQINLIKEENNKKYQELELLPIKDIYYIKILQKENINLYLNNNSKIYTINEILSLEENNNCNFWFILKNFDLQELFQKDLGDWVVPFLQTNSLFKYLNNDEKAETKKLKDFFNLQNKSKIINNNEITVEDNKDFKDKKQLILSQINENKKQEKSLLDKPKNISNQDWQAAGSSRINPNVLILDQEQLTNDIEVAQEAKQIESNIKSDDIIEIAQEVFE